MTMLVERPPYETASRDASGLVKCRWPWRDGICGHVLYAYVGGAAVVRSERKEWVCFPISARCERGHVTRAEGMPT